MENVPAHNSFTNVREAATTRIFRFFRYIINILSELS